MHSTNGTNWAYVVLAVLTVAIGNGWNIEEIRALGYVLLAILAIVYARGDRH